MEFAHRCIDAGAHAILGHGPHELRGIEIYKGRPIFYSLGNFIFQTDTVHYQPSEAFENRNMPMGSMVGEMMDVRSKNGTRGYCVQENIWRSVMAGFTAEDGEITEIQLYPIDLHMGASAAASAGPIPRITMMCCTIWPLCASLTEPSCTSRTVLQSSS